MKITNTMQHSIVIAGKNILAGETKTIKDKEWEAASEGRVIKALVDKRCLVLEESKPLPKETKKQIKQEDVTEELKSFYDL